MRCAFFSGFDEAGKELWDRGEGTFGIGGRGVVRGLWLRFFGTEAIRVEEAEVGVFLWGVASFPMAGAGEVALVFAVFDMGVLGVFLFAFPVVEVFPAYVIELASTCSVSYCFTGSFVDRGSAAKVVAVMEASAGCA